MFVLVNPPVQAPDESSHLVRAYGVSRGRCVSERFAEIPTSLAMLAPVYPVYLSRVRRVELAEYWQLLHRPLRPEMTESKANPAMNQYSCIPYLPAAVAIGIARGVGGTVGSILYMVRIANLAVYLIIVYLALLFAPDFHWVLFLVALLPTGLYQASSASIDGFVIATALLFFAVVLRLAFDSNIRSISKPLQIGLVGLAVVLAAGKINIILLPALLLIPAAKFGGQKRRVIALASIALAGMAAIAGWAYWNSENIVFAAEAHSRLTVERADNIRQALAEPQTFVLAALRSIFWQGRDYVRGFAGSFSYAPIYLPNWAVFIYGVVLFAAGHARSGVVSLQPWQRAVLALVSVITALITMFLLWIGEIPRSLLQQIAAHQPTAIPGIQGRYFIPTAPFLLAALSFGSLRLPMRVVSLAAIAVVVVSNLTAVESIARTFYGSAQPVSPRALELNGPDRIGVYRAGQWLLDCNGNRRMDLSDVASLVTTGDGPDSLPVAGDWTGDGRTKIGLFRQGQWALDWNGDKELDPSDRRYEFGIAGDKPVTGDWNGDRKSEIGVYRPSYGWLLDSDGDGVFSTSDLSIRFHGEPDDVPVSGKWNGGTKTLVGVYRRGTWLLDQDGSGTFRPVRTLEAMAGDVPVSGDWMADGIDRIGVFRNGLWLLGGDAGRTYSVTFGTSGDIPVVGRW